MTFIDDFDVIKNNHNMKAFKYILILAVISIVFACSKGDDNTQQDLQQFTSNICPAISGAKAVYWDSAHNLPTPLAQIPTLASPGLQFIHPQYPALGFIMPQGYTAEQITDSQSGAIGVNVTRADGNATWRYIPSASFQGVVPIDDIIDFEVTRIKSIHGFNAPGQIICAEDAISNEFGFETSFGSRLIEFGDFTAVVIIQTHFMSGLNRTFISVTLASGLSTQYNNLVMNTFLPIHWQLMVIDDNVRDSDLDGTPDNQDAAPFNPNIQ